MEYIHTLQASGRNLIYNSAGIPPAQLELQQSSDGSLPTRAAHRRLDRCLYDLGSRFSTCFYLLRILPSLRPRTPGSPSGCGWYVTTGRGVRPGVGCCHRIPTTITCDAHPSQVPGHTVCGTKAERLLHIDVKAARSNGSRLERPTTYNLETGRLLEAKFIVAVRLGCWLAEGDRDLCARERRFQCFESILQGLSRYRW